MAHTHDHQHTTTITNVNKAFIIGIVLNSVFVVVQLIYGIKIHSLSLISDAGHNFADVASLILSLLAFKLHKVKANQKYTYGYRKTSILVALINSIILLISLGIICYEAVLHLMHPRPLPGITVAVVAFVGVIINGVSALFFIRNKDNDLNLKSAFLHLAADALVSFGIVVGGILIYYTGWYEIDAILSIIIAIVILYSTWNLLTDSIQLSMDGVPHNVNLNDIQKTALSINGINNIHHIHVWALSTSENALTAHLQLNNSIDIEQEQQIKHLLKEKLFHLNIHHITLETERDYAPCDDGDCSNQTT